MDPPVTLNDTMGKMTNDLTAAKKHLRTTKRPAKKKEPKSSEEENRFDIT